MSSFDENNRLELKESLNDTLEKEIVAFLNTDGGTIYIGINKNKEVVGIKKDIDVVQRRISDIITDRISPRCVELIYVHKETINNKDVIQIDVTKGDKLYYIKKYGLSENGCYIRIGSTCKSLNPDEIMKRFVSNLHKVDIIDMESRNQSLTYEVLKIYLKEHHIDFKDEYFDDTFELKTKDGKYNEMAYLLSDQFNESIKVCRFKGKGGNLVMRKEFGNGCLFKIYNEIKDYMQSQENIVRTYFDNGTRRDEYLYSQTAFVEAWKNAILHNDYAEKQYPAIYLYDDHLEVFSNGNPLRNINFNEFIAGKSRPINRSLTKIAMNIEITDQTGKGNKDIVEIYGIDAFEITEHTLTVKIPYNSLAMNKELNDAKNDAKKEAKNDAKKLEEKLIELIEQNKQITKVLMAKQTGFSKATIERCLKNSNKIKYIGSKKSGHWEIISN